MDDTTFWAQFGANLKVAIRQFSSYIIIAAGVALQALVGDPMVSAKVASFLSNVALGWLAPYSGVVVVALGALSKAWPQVSVTKAAVAAAPASVVAAQNAKNVDAGKV